MSMPAHKVFRDYFEGLVIVVLIGFILRSFVFSAYRIDVDSMEPALKRGDIVLVYKLKYLLPTSFLGNEKSFKVKLPRYQDLFIFRAPDLKSSAVGRVVGLPGDRVKQSSGDFVVVPPGEVYISGGIPDPSATGPRSGGLVPIERLIGRLLVVLFSVDDPEKLGGSSQVRWDRSLTRLR